MRAAVGFQSMMLTAMSLGGAPAVTGCAGGWWGSSSFTLTIGSSSFTDGPSTFAMARLRRARNFTGGRAASADSPGGCDELGALAASANPCAASGAALCCANKTSRRVSVSNSMLRCRGTSFSSVGVFLVLLASRCRSTKRRRPHESLPISRV
eukprot:9485627-Pyramimonas_sp.AAC.3